MQYLFKLDKILFVLVINKLLQNFTLPFIIRLKFYFKLKHLTKITIRIMLYLFSISAIIIHIFSKFSENLKTQ